MYKSHLNSAVFCSPVPVFRWVHPYYTNANLKTTSGIGIGLFCVNPCEVRHAGIGYLFIRGKEQTEEPGKDL